MHFSAAIIGAYLAASAVAVVLPQPEVNIHISFPVSIHLIANPKLVM